MSLSPGQLLSGYRVLGALGSGGMGEVYRARDTRLERDVAIKVLPEGWDDDETHVQRFLREARTLASLSHANVAHVYDFDQLDGRRYLVLELVEGEDLTERIARGPLPPAEAAGICRQIAEGLEAAHELGVIHRDLKPANVRITQAGGVKVLDFGLAKSLRVDHEPGEPTPDRPPTFQTETGLLVGTPSYMSPERIRGRPVDRRADIWAFGCVLFECLTGRSPFEGATLPDTLARIVDREPDLTALPRATPAAIRTLIARCLDKDPRTRLRDIGEARVVLAGDLSPSTTLETRSAQTGMRGVIPYAVMVVALVAMVVLYARPAPAPTRSGFWDRWEQADVSKVTDFTGTEFDASISHDGKFIVFAADKAGRFDAWLTQIGSGEFRNLTNGGKTTWWLKIRDVGFNREGTRVWLSGGTSGRMRSIPVLGGEPREIFGEKFVNVHWSPDRTRLTYHTSHPGDPLFVADADGTNPRRILDYPNLHQHYPTWSSDGEWVYVTRGRPATMEMDLWRVSRDGRVKEQLSWDKLDVGHAAPIDENNVLYVAREPNGAGPWLWHVDLQTKESKRATVGVERYTSIDATADGNRLVASVGNPVARLWSVDIPESGMVGEGDVKPVAGLEDRRALLPRFSRSGDLFFLSSRGTSDGLWRMAGGKPEEVLSGDGRPLLQPPAVSADGRSVAVVVKEGSRLELHVMTADGSSRRVVSGGLDVRGSPTWSPDGKWIAIGGTDEQGPGLFKLPLDGGEAVRVVAGDALNPIWSPTADVIVYAGKQVMGLHPLLAVRASDNKPIPMPKTIFVVRLGEACRFLPDGRMVYLQGGPPTQDFHLLDLETGEGRRLTKLEDTGRMRTFDIDPSGTRVVFDRVFLNSDIVLIDLPPQAK